MLSHREMIGFQAEQHELIDEDRLVTAELYALHLIHGAAYTHAARVVDGKFVLDIGCNTGYGTNILAARAKSAVGIDVSDRAIGQAKEKYASKGPVFHVVDGVKIPFDDDVFDVVTSFQVIEHLVEYETFLQEVKRVLAPDGIAIFTTPNSLLRLDPGMKPWNEFHVREFNPEEVACTLGAYFNEVSVLGLYAGEPLYSIEVNRLNKARQKARASASDLQVGRRINLNVLLRSMRTRIKSVLPAPVLNNLKTLQLPKKRKMLRELKENHGVEDFYYRVHDLNEALDFMAICSEAEIAPYVESMSRHES